MPELSNRTPNGGTPAGHRTTHQCVGFLGRNRIAGFAMVEGVLLLAQLVKHFEFEAIKDRVPTPVAHLTVRAENGIYLKIKTRK